MNALRYKRNHGYVCLYPGKNIESVGVYMADGRVTYKRFLGFLELEAARLIKGAIPVKLDVQQYSDDMYFESWVTLPEGKYVQGCLIESGVYAVTRSAIKVV